MTNKVLIKKSGTANAVPTAGDLLPGELAINYADGNLFYKNSGNVVTAIASNKFVSVSGNIQGANLNAVGLSLSGNVLSAINSTSNVTTTGNIEALPGGFFIGDGSQLTGIIVSAGAAITNGSSNVSVYANGNITVGVTGTSNVVVFAPTGVSVIGTIAANGTITGGNIDAGSGTISTSGNVTGGNVSAGSGVITTSGNITGGNITTAGQLVSTQTGSATTGAGQLYLNGATLNRIDYNTNGVAAPAFTTRSAGTKIALYPALSGSAVDYALGVEAGALWSSIPGADGGQYFKWYGGETQVGYLSGTGVLSVVGNITGANLNAAGLSLSSNVLSQINSTSNITTSANIAGGYFLGNGSLLSGIITSVANINNGTSNVSISAPNANVTVSVNGTANVAVFADTGVSVIGTIAANSNITGGNLNAAGLSLSSNVVSALNVTANIAGGNITTPGLISATGNITTANTLIATGAPATGLTAAVIGNVSNVNFHSQSVAALGGNANGSVQFAFQNYSALANASTDLAIYNNLGTDSTYFIDMGIVSSTYDGQAVGANVFGANDGYLYVVGSSGTGPVGAGANVGNLIIGATNGQVITFLGNTSTGNIITVVGPTGLNVTGVVSATGNITGGNILGGANVNATTHTGATVSVTGNITGGNLNAAGLSLSSNVVSALNVTSSIAAGTTINAVGNITGGNLITAAAVSAASVSASGNVTGGNLITAAAVSAASVSASGNVTGGNVNTNTIVGTATTIKSTGELNLSATANITVNNQYINGLLDPVQNQDAATKNYVDTVAQGLDSKASVHTATTAALPAYTYNNGTSGVGATLTGTATGTLTIAGDTILLNQRVLVKDETGAFVNNTTMSAAFNGIYLCTTEGAVGVAFVLTRATDFNTAAEMYSAFTFVETGTGVADTGWVCTNNIANPITVGTTQITFTQFSGAGTYSANTSAGLVLNGTVFSAKTDNITTAFDGTGNIIVKTGAVFTTPNIGAATGTSVSVTGNITGGNLNAAGLSLSSNVISQINSTSNITTTGNISGGNILGGANVNATTHTGTTVSVTGNITGGNLNAAGLSLSSNVVSALVSAANITTTANISGGNILGGANVNATTHTGTTVSVTGNITGGNLNAAGLSLSSNVVSALVSAANITTTANISAGNIIGTLIATSFSTTGNITGGNLNAAGLSLSSNVVSALVSAANITTTANISGGNILGGANVNATTHTGTTVSVTGTITGASVVGGVITGSSTSVTGNVTGGNLIQGGIRVFKWITSETTPTFAVPGDQWFIASTGKRYEYWNDGTSNVWVDQSQSTSFDALAVSGAATITGALTVGSILTVATSSITNTGANGVGNIGNATGYFNTIFAKATSAQYADLAETYVPDGRYTYGTVVIFGGDKEITVSNVSHDTRVAGVISKNPAHLMNSAIEGVPVALTGRVLCQVRGPVQKGDILVNIESGTAGRLDPALASWGCVVGKSLVDHPTNDVAMIEIAVGRF